MPSYEFVPPGERPKKQQNSDAPKSPTKPELSLQERFDLGASHREKVTDWLCQGFVAGTAKCCIIGPGCGAHLNLTQLLDHFTEVQLIDVTQEGLDLNLQAQSIDAEKLQTDVLSDFAGITTVLGQLQKTSATQELKFHDVQEGIEAAMHLAPWPVAGKVDIVLATEGLGMALSATAAIVGHQHPSLPDFHHAIRLTHAREILRILKPGGYGILVNQLMSSKVMPSLPNIPEEKLDWVMSEVIQKNGGPTGTSPTQIRDLLLHDQAIKHELAHVHMLTPWIFDTGPVQFAMSGVSFCKASPPDPATSEKEAIS